MTLLGQQELVEPEPQRMLITQHGGVWGCDPSTRHCALATIDPNGLRGYELVPYPRVAGVPRLSAIYAEVRRLACDVASLVPPGLVAVEQPSGKNVSRELSYAVAVTMLGLHDGIVAAGVPAPVFESPAPGWWKLRATGHGNVYKPTREKLGRPPRPDEYGVLRWAWANGLPFGETSWDVADAWGIAEAMRRTVRLDIR